MAIGSPHAHTLVESTAFGLYYDEDEDGRYGPVGSQQLTDYHYTKPTYPASDYTTGYMTGEFWLVSATCGIFDEHGNHDAIQCGSRHDYHSLMPNPIDEIMGDKGKVPSTSGIFAFHKTNYTASYAVGSLHPTITIGCMI